MLQIVNDKIKVYDPMKDMVFDEQYVMNKFGIKPERIPEFMALTGDAVDNIPGIKGVGEKTARELLTQFDNLEDMLQNTARIKKEKFRHLVSENADIVRLSQKLATLNNSVPIDIDIDEFTLREPDWLSLLALFKELEFGSLMKLIPSGSARDISNEIILSAARLKEVTSMIRDEVALDTEATARHPVAADLVGISLCAENGRAFYIPVSHTYPGMPAQLNKREVASILSPVLASEKVAKIGHNLKFDLILLEKEGVQVRGPLFDTMVASYLLNPNKPNHSLEEVSLEYLSHRKKSFMEVVKKRSSFAEVPLEDASPYACADAHLALELKEVLFRKLREDNLEELYFSIEMPLIAVLADMEKAGVKIDSDKLAEIYKELEREVEGITRRIYFLAGEEFNINSPKQLSRILFQTLGLQPGKKTKTGFSTNVSVLEELAASHELPREILTYRSLTKLQSTYISVLPMLVNQRTGRIHTSFNQTVTSTGRLSSSEPNLQNIPIKGEWGTRIRETFIAEKDHLLLSADYSQVELRLLAHLSNDEGLIDAFRKDLDIHSRTAAEIFGIPIERVTTDIRRVAKTVNFGVIYGISPFGLSETLSIPGNDARKYIEQYFQRHPGVKVYIERSIEEAKMKGCVSTIFGRKRAIPEVLSKNAAVRQQGERLAVNSPIQGTAADIIKLAMIRIAKTLREKSLKATMILQVHDELLFELPPEELDILTDIVRREMEGIVTLSVPLKVDIHHGNNWAEAH
jgi:DNA polymerase-1